MNSDNVPCPRSAATASRFRVRCAGLRRKTDLLRRTELRQSHGDLLRVGVIGYGYWGPNIVRNLHSLENCEVVAVCDKNPAVASPRQPAVSGDPADDGLRRHSDVAAHRRRRRRHAGLDAFRAGEGGARKRQARLRRKTVHVERRAGRGADRAGRSEEPQAHGGPHVSLQRPGDEDPGARRQRRAGAALLLRLDPGEPRPLPARRQRHLGPGAARPVDHGPHHPGEARGGRRDGRQAPERPGRRRVHHRLLSRATSSRT